jgi:hypothetical protein
VCKQYICDLQEILCFVTRYCIRRVSITCIVACSGDHDSDSSRKQESDNTYSVDDHVQLFMCEELSAVCRCGQK